MTNESSLSHNEYLRYTRHLQLPQVGLAGQLKLKQSRVCLVGCGGLGAPVGLYLAAAGVGFIKLIDDDQVELSNLQRQIHFDESSIGKSKAQQSQQRLTDLNQTIQVASIQARLSDTNASDLLNDVDLIIDCSDNFATRYAINNYTCGSKKPWLYASIFQFSGQCALFEPNHTTEDIACYRCLFPEPPVDAPDCNTAGVIGVLPGILGSIQALEAIKYLLDLPGRLSNQLMLVETLPFSTRTIQLNKDPQCLSCGIHKDLANQPSTSAHYQRPDHKPLYNKSLEHTSENAMSNYLIELENFQQACQSNDYFIVDVRNSDEHQAFNLGGVNIPLDQLANHPLLDNIEDHQTVIFYCHAGKRSDMAAHWARDNLDNPILSLKGGVTAYPQLG